MSEKTHQPTAKKLEDARKKGQIPRSKLFTSAAVTLGGLGATLAFAGDTSRRFVGWTRSLLGALETNPTDAMTEGVRVLALCAAPSLVGATCAAGLSAVAMSGFQFNADLVSPKLERLDFTEGVKKLFSARQLVDVLKGLAVAAIIGWLFWSAIESNASVALSSLHHDGDPHQKAKRKSLHKQLAAGGSARGVAKATAIVVNPTHIAVALRYAEDECEAPYIVARGREEDALKIRKEAAALGIPIVRDIPLARSLVHYDVGEEVPEELYQAAAAILKVALEVSGKDTKEES